MLSMTAIYDYTEDSMDLIDEALKDDHDYKKVTRIYRILGDLHAFLHDELEHREREIFNLSQRQLF